MKDKDDNWIEKLILDGAIEIAGVDENGELLYNFTDKLKEIDPVLYDKAFASMYDDARILWMKGFLEMDITDPNPIVQLNRKSFIREEIEELPLHLQKALAFFIDAFLNR
jgi:hypothetical protein